MAATPRHGGDSTPSLLFNTQRGGDRLLPRCAAGLAAGTPGTPASRLQAAVPQTPRTDLHTPRFPSMPSTESRPPPTSSLLAVTTPIAQPRPAEDAGAAAAGWTVPAVGATPYRGVYGEAVPRAASQAAAQAIDEWVTVFGFPPEQRDDVLREFQKCGEVVDSGAFAPVPANWVHIRYSHVDEAQRALMRDGFQLNNSLIIGVKPLDPRQRAAVSDHASNNLPVRPALRMNAPPVERPYLIGKPTGAGGALSGLEPSTSLMAKIQRYVLGL